MKEKVLITGIGGPAGKSVVTYMNRMGFFTIGVDMRDVSVPVGSFHRVPPVDHPSFWATLLRIIEMERPGLFVPTVQEELPLVARLRETIENRGCFVSISPAPAVSIAHDKMKTALFAADRNLAVPRSLDAKTSRDVVLHILGLPLLVKPCIGRGGRGVRLYRTATEVYGETRCDIVFQEFIPGEEFDVNLFMDHTGNALEGIVLKKTRLKEGIVGNALAVEKTERRPVLGLAIAAARALGLVGPIDMDIRLRSDETPVLLEINARIGGNVLSAPEILSRLIKVWHDGKQGEAA